MTYPIRTGVKPPPQARAQVERAEALTGSRNGSTTEKKAITREDAGKLGAVGLTAVHVSSAPTAAQYNALVDDLRTIATVLNGMGANIILP